MTPSNPQDVPIIIAGNKTDLVREVDHDEAVTWVHSTFSDQRYTLATFLI